MKEIKAYITSDNKIHINKDLAENHEHELKYYNELKSIVDWKINGTYGADQDGVLEFLIENQRKLQQIFKKYRGA